MAKVFRDFKNWLIQVTMYSNILFRVFVPSLFGTIQGQWALFGKTKSISFFFFKFGRAKGQQMAPPYGKFENKSTSRH